MTTDIRMPALSPTMTEGKLARWLKKVGDEVRAGDVIAEIETDKATMEVEAIEDGKLARILVEEGAEGIPVNTPIAILAAEGEMTGNLRTDAGEVVREREPSPDQGFSVEEWEQVKAHTLRLIIEATLDSPEHHLAYIRERIAGGGSRHA